MLDFVLVVVVLVMTAVTFLYARACAFLLQHDVTRDISGDQTHDSSKV